MYLPSHPPTSTNMNRTTSDHERYNERLKLMCKGEGNGTPATDIVRRTSYMWQGAYEDRVHTTRMQVNRHLQDSLRRHCCQECRTNSSRKSDNDDGLITTVAKATTLMSDHLKKHTPQTRNVCSRHVNTDRPCSFASPACRKSCRCNAD